MEPQSPPPLPTQPPRRNWWQRNWKWFVPTGCFTLIALVVLFVLCIVFFAFSILKSSDAYKIAVTRAKSDQRSEEHTSELQSQSNLVCRLLLEKKNKSSPQ